MRCSSAFFPCLLGSALAGCSPTADDRSVIGTGSEASPVDGAADAGSGAADAADDRTNDDPNVPSARDDGCSDAARLVYVIDNSGELSSFRPDTGTFTSIGTLDCPEMSDLPDFPIPVPGLGGSPFSMSVDRDGIAWVLFDSGELFRVDTANASCTATSRMPGGEGFTTFGMGFATNAAGSSDETLYIAGAGGGSFGTLDLNTMQATVLGGVNGSPELTGTGAGELWGFFPDTSPPRIDRMNKTSGVAERSLSLSTLEGDPQAWAFAFWGGAFWLFLQRADDASTVVYRVDAQSGALTTSIANSGKRIVGAGVSTCAPVEVL